MDARQISQLVTGIPVGTLGLSTVMKVLQNGLLMAAKIECLTILF